MAELVGGAVIGAVFGELLKAVLEMKDKAIMFKSTLTSLRTTLVAIAPVIKQIEQFNHDLGHPKEELESLIRDMEEGTKLVSKCSKINRFNYPAKVRHQEQLEALVDSLVKFFIVDLQAQTARDQKETLLKVRRIFSAVNKFPFVNTVASTSESEINHDLNATQPDENALANIAVKEAMEYINQLTISSSSDFDTVPVDVRESESTATQPAGTNSAEQVMELEPTTAIKLEAGQVSSALSRAGLVSSNLIIGIDFTKSNEWTGKMSFNRRSLHSIGNGHNPYEQAISIIGKTLSSFDEDNLIPCFGFGDASTHDQGVFSFNSDERLCSGFEEVLSRYREIVPCLRLSGPTSFAPIIEMAITIVEKSGGKFHVLLIIADGQVTKSYDDSQRGQLSPQERRTIDAIVKASEYPLSIVLVGVGDGPWDMMREFDDNIPARAFDNFQFVNFTEIMSKSVDSTRKETEFALAALMDIPSQYKATIDLGILGVQRGHSPDKVSPPHYDGASSSNVPSFLSNFFQERTYLHTGYGNGINNEPSSSGLYDNKVTATLSRAGLVSSNLIIGIDFTKSNEWTGKKSFNGKSLHHIGKGHNPYEQAISIIGKTLSSFNENNLIPCFGFGDATTYDRDIFSFHSDERICNGFEEVLSRYREIVPHLRLAGPTSFAPIIEMAITIVEKSGGKHHVLLIIADGQVTVSCDRQCGQLSPQERRTIDAIVKASEYPLSIVLVGVGDGPWDMMREFDDNIPARAFDNFEFVNFTEIMSKSVDSTKKEAEFSLAALMDIPSQYKATIDLGILGARKGHSPERVPLPPPY